MARYGIVVDIGRCTGCMTCVLACKAENDTPPGVWWNQVLEIEDREQERIAYVRCACMHCENPPCVEACPQGAIFRRFDGIVLIDEQRCRASGHCVGACPYGAIAINPDQQYFSGKAASDPTGPGAGTRHRPGRPSKCTLCAHRIDRGKEPACVEACPSRAMIFGDLDDPEDPAGKKAGQATALLPSEETRPRILYIRPESLARPLEDRIREDPRMKAGQSC